MLRSAAALTVSFTAVLLAGCGPTSVPPEEPKASPSPSPIEGDTSELQTGFEELSGLIVPADASDMEIKGEMMDDRPHYELRFVTTRGGAEIICTADNFDVYPNEGPPRYGEDEVFDYREEDSEIAESVLCEGSNPQQPRVQRKVSVVFPKDGLKKGPGEPDGKDIAVVYAYSVLWPRR
ncbi:hypothetical protein J0910_24465 [Nocardiopsis sp. CNT-189]|uniref:hypothetical protein n=1 Tax=Nocardiopsis oceanisediminis TaxID=2816862 RepID=UPI003B3120BA